MPREDLAAYNRMVEDWNGDCRPRTPAERALVLEIANAQWKLQRVESAQDERVAAGIGDAGTREDVAVFKKMERLFWSPRGPLSTYALWPLAHGGPPASGSGQVDDPNQPYLLVKDLEASAKGCQALLDEWAILRSRVEDNLPWQPPDRLKAIRMLGKQPIDVAIDRRIAQIYLTTYAMHPLGQKNAYDDLKCDLVTIDLEPFLKRVRKRWPLMLDPENTETARQTLLDLIERVVERLEGIRDAHLATRKRSRKRPPEAWRSIPRRRASGWHATRCSATDGFINAWTRSGSTGGKWSGRRRERTKIRRNTTWCGQRNGWCSSTYCASKTKMRRPKPIRFRLRWKLKPIKGFWAPEKHLSWLMP